jgi:hypothetical protein
MKTKDVDSDNKHDEEEIYLRENIIVNSPAASHNSLSIKKNKSNIRSYLLGGENFELDERFEALEILGIIYVYIYYLSL